MRDSDLRVRRSEELVRIVARAATFSERNHTNRRLLPGQTHDDGEAATGSEAERLEHWAQAVGKGDMAALQHRLALAGYSPDDVRSLLRPAQISPELQSPDWTKTLSAIVDAMAGASFDSVPPGEPGNERGTDVENPQPFEAWLIPCMVAGRRKLRTHPVMSDERLQLSDVALADLERYLLELLAQISAPTLKFEFRRFLLRREPYRAFLEPAEMEAQPEGTAYSDFVAQTSDPEWAWAFFAEYSVLARLLAETVDGWAEVAGEFLARLVEDWPAIKSTILGEPSDESPDRVMVEGIAAGLSDPHNGGRTVFRVELAGGLKLIYKPHGLAMECAYQGFVTWINAESGLLPLKTIRVLDRESHGWVELVGRHPCEGEAAQRNFFTRYGMLIALLYALSGVDFHFENVVASGEQLVPVDLEMLLNAPVAIDGSEGGDAVLHRLRSLDVGHTILNSGLLPVASPAGERKLDGSLLGNMSEFAHQHVEEVVAGFRQMYRFLSAHKETLTDPKGPLSSFYGLTSRFVFRPTRLYLRMWQSSLHPDFMREGIDRHIQLEHLGRIYRFGERESSRFLPLLNDEIAALARNDIPFFNVQTHSRSLMSSGGEHVPDCFELSGYDQVLKVMSRLGEDDLQAQMATLRLALFSKLLPISLHLGVKPTDIHVAPQFIPASGVLVDRNNGEVILEPEAFLAEAERIADRLSRAALSMGERGAHWLTLDLVHGGKSYAPAPAGEELYGGRTGIALFYSALWQQTKARSHREMALAALRGLRERIRFGNTIELVVQGIGGAVGLGSIVYGLSRCSHFLGDESILADAEELAKLITPTRIAEDERLDVLGGAAGAILGLLALYDLNGSQVALQRSILCGEHLVRAQVEHENGGRAWPAMDKKALTGFSHGAAGISYALLRLAAVCDGHRFRQAATDGLAFESVVYAPSAGNWPDFRFENNFRVSWCHGAAGIALSRMGIMPYLDNPAIRQDLTHGLDTTLAAVAQANLSDPADLCCGHWGRADILFHGGLVTHNDDYRVASLALASKLVDTANRNGGHLLKRQLPPDVVLPGFFKGLAGIGYTCLRLAQDKSPGLPAVLLWE